MLKLIHIHLRTGGEQELQAAPTSRPIPEPPRKHNNPETQGFLIVINHFE